MTLGSNAGCITGLSFPSSSFSQAISPTLILGSGLTTTSKCLSGNGIFRPLPPVVCGSITHTFSSGTNSANAPSKPPTSKPLFLDDGSISFNETSVLLTNNEDKNWTSCTFSLLPANFSGKEIYKYDTLTLDRAKEKVEIPLKDFAMEGGKRFDNKTTKPSDLRADCYRDDKEHSGFFTEGVNYKDIQKYYEK